MIEEDWLKLADAYNLFQTLSWKSQLPMEFNKTQYSSIMYAIRKISPVPDH